MSRKRSQFLSDFGKAFQIFKTIVDALLKAGGSDEDLGRVLSDQGLADGIAQVIISKSRQTFRVAVDYTQTLKQMISAGKYDWVNGDITQDHFPIKGNGKKEEEVVLFHFDKVMTSEQAITEMDKTGFRPATIEELLALGAQQPELQKQFPIVALGSVWRRPSGSRDVPCLSWIGRQRRLDLDWFEGAWDGGCRFAAVCK